MAVYSMNNSIKSYVSFINSLENRETDAAIENSLQTLRNIYIKYNTNPKTCSEITWLSENLSNSEENDVLFSFTTIEQVWAYVHLILEHTVNKLFDIWNKGLQADDIPFYQQGLSKLWAKKHKNVMTIFCPDVDTSKHYIEGGTK